MDYWYAIHSFSGREKACREKLLKAFPGLRTLFPQRSLEIRKEGKAKVQMKPFFPGYFFMCLHEPLESLRVREYTNVAGMIGNQKGILRILGADDPYYHHIPVAEMAHVLFLTSNGDREEVAFSEYHKAGDKVKVISGPLFGQETIIRRVNPRKKRITVVLTMFGVEREIDLGGELVEKL